MTTETRPAGTHRLSVMDHTGHTPLDFDPRNSAAVAEAQAKFDALVKGDKFIAAEMDGNGGNTVVKAFNPEAEETVLFRQLVGG